MNTIDPAAYPIADIDALPSPRLLVFRDRVDANIELMRRHLDAVARGSEFGHLRPHAKTHKSSWIARRQLAAGIDRFKATPNEVDMLIAAGARDIVVAYPLVGHAADALAARAAARPDVRLVAQLASERHAADLAAGAARHGIELEYLVDIDVGMHRTGTPAARVEALLEAVQRAPGAERLRFAGLHAYDGHNRGATADERREQAREAMAPVVELAAALERRGVAVPLVIAGGTPGFLPDLELLLAGIDPRTHVEVSPGTWIYWDTGYDARMPGLFELAALVLARVMDRPGDDLITLDLGHKRWGIDNGPVDRFSVPGLSFVSASEEHTVLRVDRSACPQPPEVGDALLLAPKHVCSTVNFWEEFTIVGPSGEIETPASPVDARNR